MLKVSLIKNLHLIVLLIVIVILALSLVNVAGAQSPTPSGEAQHWMPSAVWSTPTPTPYVFTTTLGTVYSIVTPIPPVYNPNTGVSDTALVQSVTGPSGPSMAIVPMYPPGAPLPPVVPNFTKPQQDMIFERLARQCGIRVQEILRSFSIINGRPGDEYFTQWETDPRTARYFFDALARCSYYTLPAGDKLMLAIDQAAHYSAKAGQASQDAMLVDLADPALKVKVVSMLTAIMNTHALIIGAGGGLE